MTDLTITEHMEALRVATGLEREDFVRLLCASAVEVDGKSSRLEAGPVNSWFDGARSRYKTRQRLCTRLQELAADYETWRVCAKTPAPPPGLARIHENWFHGSIEAFSAALARAPDGRTGTNGAAKTAPETLSTARLEDLFVLLRATRFGGADPRGAIATETLVVEERGRGPDPAALLTRKGRLYRGAVEVVGAAAYCRLRWCEPERDDRVSVRNLNLSAPALGRADVYGGLLQRSTSSDGRPSSAVVAALRLTAFVTDSAVLERGAALVEALNNDPVMLGNGVLGPPLAGTLAPETHRALCDDIARRLAEMVYVRDLGWIGENRMREDAAERPGALSISTVAPGEVAAVWNGFDLTAACR